MAEAAPSVTRRELAALRALDDVAYESEDGWAVLEDIADALRLSDTWVNQRMQNFVMRGLAEVGPTFEWRLYAPTELTQVVLDAHPRRALDRDRRVNADG